MSRRQQDDIQLWCGTAKFKGMTFQFTQSRACGMVQFQRAIDRGLEGCYSGGVEGRADVLHRNLCLKLATRVQGDDAPGHVVVLAIDKTGIFQHCQQRILVGVHPD